MRQLLSSGLLAAIVTLAPTRTLTPIIRVEQYPSGAVQSRSTWTRDHLDGVVERFYESGARESRTTLWGGVKVGHFESWWPNGSSRVRAFYLEGAYDGELRTWYADGHPYELRHYTAGHEAGRQQSWTDDGELFLNYDVRDGRRYGLINARPCLPAAADGTSIYPE